MSAYQAVPIRSGGEIVLHAIRTYIICIYVRQYIIMIHRPRPYYYIYYYIIERAGTVYYDAVSICIVLRAENAETIRNAIFIIIARGLQ